MVFPTRFAALLLGFLLLSAGCPVSVAPQPPPVQQPIAPVVQPPSVPAAGAAAGAVCNQPADCQSGVCEGGCGNGQATCVDANRACTMDIAQYCGCDGLTFTASGSCPQRQFAARGACATVQ